MAVEVVMPKLGNEIESCVILAWRKREGETVARGEPVCEIETDKATFEVESPASGVLLKVFFQPGDDVPVQTTIAVIGESGEDVSAISPRAKRAADAAGLDASTVAGTGPGGRVIERDVREAVAGREPLTPAAKDLIATPRWGTGIGGHVRAADLADAPVPVVPDYSALGPVREIAVKGMRKTIAARLLHSARTTAAVTLHATADASALRAARAQLKTDARTCGITINDLVLRETVRVLPKHPALNAWWLGERILEFSQVHLAVAVQTPRGLLAPVIRRAEALSLVELSAEAKRLRQACLDGAARPQDMAGATFTVTNLGPQGVEFFTPILNPPEVAILGVGCIVTRPVEGPGGLRMVPRLGLSLTFDHQAIDGHGAAVFLEALAEAIARIEGEDRHG